MNKKNYKHQTLSEILYEMAKLSQSSVLTEKNLLYITESIASFFGFENMMTALYNTVSKKFIPHFVIGFDGSHSKELISSEFEMDLSFFSVSSVKIPAEPTDYFKTLTLDSEVMNMANTEALANLKNDGFKSMFIIPMMTSGKIFGAIIAFQKTLNHGLTEVELHDLSVLVQISTFLAENLYLRVDASQKISKMTTLYEISQQTKNILKPTDILGSLVDGVKGLIDYSICALYINDPEAKELYLKDSRGDDPGIMGSSVKYGAGPHGEVAVSKKPMLSHFGIYKSFLAVPIITDEKLIGVICLGNVKSYAYNEDDIITVKILTSQIASVDNLFSTLVSIRNYTDAIIESMPLGIMTIDDHSRISIINQAAKNYLNINTISHEDIVGKKIDELLEEHLPIIDCLVETLSTGYIYENFDFYNPKSKMNFELTTFQLKNAEGVRIGVAMFLRDVSKLKQMEDHVRRADRLSALGELASGIAHEIRNPLTGIKMVIQLLDKDFEKKEAAPNKYTKVILEEIDRVDNIISNLLNFARPSKPEFNNTSVVKIIETILLLVESKIKLMNTTVIREFPEKEVLVLCDSAQIKQVFLNLLQNSLQAMRMSENNILKISIKEENEYLYISISDNGCGIPHENLKQIFDPFFTTKDNGTGLGLSIVHRIIEEHGGSITVESEVGKGSTFTVKLLRSINNEC
ncbi:MAG: ATP-binding protein [Candidatus Wallbacteria bacterium]